MDVIQAIFEFLGVHGLDKVHILFILVIFFLATILVKRGKNFITDKFDELTKNISDSTEKVAKIYEASKDPNNDILLTRGNCLRCLQNLTDSVEQMDDVLRQSQNELLAISKHMSSTMEDFKRDGESARKETRELIHTVALDVRKVVDELLGITKFVIRRVTDVQRQGKDRESEDIESSRK
jgi:hypothetical protein